MQTTDMKNEIAEICHRLSLGVYVIGVGDRHRHDAFTAASVMQASYEPLLLAVSINPEHAAYPMVRTARSFTVNVLRKDQLGLARHFGTQSGRDLDKLQAVSWQVGRTGAPILSDAMAWFDCELAAVMPAGDHQIVLGRVIDGELVESDAAPMLYRDTGNMDGSRELYPEHFF
jgi:flavin reductase (DIM6/NTAB) family NADH-FMN oxidoreductase RutF